MLTLAFFVLTSLANASPEQLRLALGTGLDSMNIGWTTVDMADSIVQWGLTKGLGQEASGQTTPFTVDPGRTWHMHQAVMVKLAPSRTYFYRVGSNQQNEWSEIYSFKSAADASTLAAELPQVHVLLGDMGSAFAYSLCPDCTSNETCVCTNKTAGIIAEEPDMILHVGDFAYDLDSDGGLTGDRFFQNIEPVAARFPYMVSHGNHEDGDVSLARYTESFRHMPPGPGTVKSINGVAPNNWYFSWDAGLVHYISISTEIQGGAMLSRGGTQLIADQFHFLESDLKKANANRANVPWIVVNGHRSMYCSCDGDCDTEAAQQRLGPWTNGTLGFEKLFFEQGVDFFINGHEHNYERNWPTYLNKTYQSNTNPKAPIYIVTGAAGCKELHEPFTRPQPPRSAFRSNTFGYSRMIIYNHSHVQWQQIMTDPTFFGPDKYGKIIDDVWVVQPNHGPFDAAQAPTSYEGQGVPSTSIDHWDGHAHPTTGLRLPKGSVWKSDENTRENARLAKFLSVFGDTVWEDNHDYYHSTMADLMKSHAAETDSEARRRIELRMQQLGAEQA